METEIELKFFVSPEYSDILYKKIAETKVLQHSCRELGNTYFDTSDNQLRQSNIGLRIRRVDDVYVQTVKTGGRVVAGLHQRPEYNAEHTCNLPDLSLHPTNIWPDTLPLDQLESQLTPIFSTNFTREQWLVSMADGGQIEVAFDQGVVVAGEREFPICEVELELKSGQADVLFTLARSLSEFGGMRLGNLSKAARGYRLAAGYQGDEVKPLAFVETQPNDSIEVCFIQALEHGLAHWHYHEQIYIEKESIDALKQVREAVYFIHQTLAIYGDIIPRRATVMLRQELKWLEQELHWLDSYDHLEELLDDKGYALRKLDARKFLITELKAIEDALPNRDENIKLLNSARYTGLLLDLSRWILARGWQPFLDETAQQQMSETIRPFAAKQLDRTWNELMDAFPANSQLSCQHYIDQRYRLVRSLYTGVGFASLYNFEERKSFRMPWADLLQGIDDLLAIRPLEQFLDKLEYDAQEQLKRWIIRQETSILHAMSQTRAMCSTMAPFWRE
jgi:triphosphatase